MNISIFSDWHQRLHKILVSISSDKYSSEKIEYYFQNMYWTNLALTKNKNYLILKYLFKIQNRLNAQLTYWNIRVGGRSKSFFHLVILSLAGNLRWIWRKNRDPQEPQIYPSSILQIAPFSLKIASTNLTSKRPFAIYAASQIENLPLIYAL